MDSRDLNKSAEPKRLHVSESLNKPAGGLYDIWTADKSTVLKRNLTYQQAYDFIEEYAAD